VPVFDYTAVPLAGGHPVKGTLDAESARQARAVLKERGLLAAEIEARKSGGAERSRLRLGSALLTRFSRQLSALLDAGLTVDEALTVLADQSDNEREKRLIAVLRGDIASGLSIFTAMTALPRAFPSFYPTLVKAGEESGHLPGVMQRPAVYLEERAELISKVALAFIYPAVVFVVSALVIVGMLTWVVPQMVQVFQGARQTLPLAPRLLLAISAFVGDWGLGLLALIVMAGGVSPSPCAARRFVCAYMPCASICRFLAISNAPPTPRAFPAHWRSWSAAACRCCPRWPRRKA
jgi:general secretion pathway protein F